MHRLDLDTGSLLDLRPLNKESPSLLVWLLLPWVGCLLSKKAGLRDLNRGEGAGFSSSVFSKDPVEKTTKQGKIQEAKPTFFLTLLTAPVPAGASYGFVQTEKN